MTIHWYKTHSLIVSAPIRWSSDANQVRHELTPKTCWINFTQCHSCVQDCLSSQNLRTHAEYCVMPMPVWLTKALIKKCWCDGGETQDGCLCWTVCMRVSVAFISAVMWWFKNTSSCEAVWPHESGVGGRRLILLYNKLSFRQTLVSGFSSLMIHEVAFRISPSDADVAC